MTDGYYVLPPVQERIAKCPVYQTSTITALRGLLDHWAARFTPDKDLRMELVVKTIAEAVKSYPLKNDGEALDVELFGISPV